MLDFVLFTIDEDPFCVCCPFLLVNILMFVHVMCTFRSLLVDEALVITVDCQKMDPTQTVIHCFLQVVVDTLFVPIALLYISGKSPFDNLNFEICGVASIILHGSDLAFQTFL